MKEINSIAGIRKVYQLQSLLEKDVAADPMVQFSTWWQQAIDSRMEEPNAMTLATCNAEGKPSARTVLLKSIEEDGFIFFSNYQSRKGKDIEINPYVALLFFWKELQRQVRIEGTVQKINSSQSDAYFAGRPRESQIGAWSSPQSAVIRDREVLQKNKEKFNQQFENESIPRPEYWGGYKVIPLTVEFWQGRPGRLHDRLQYYLPENKVWSLRRLAP